ncbi:uncharacterized protein MONBRDRAFT_14366 [Monosiga brevicollis MX1]|uniref:GDT1 family protein n=1 Tax=Monosiga brevicollis TaxID=81824 RepID=A9USM4_MONBE|nr:uncharacterized protein MONBRDRAFT_14366 [Monosiga brevicollis MX1]EDQ92127.1 predicted protein [Monosiga brevicollis MX1]|eukprot:XP_001743413.1 hypothetical protein [Monosiga brevicollis MX1]
MNDALIRPSVQAASFTHAFIGGLSMMVVSELGDKTFFIAAILAMRHSRFTIFCGAIGALGLMTFLSAYVGALATVIPRIYTHYIATGLFVIFGLRLLRDGYNMADDEGAEELEEVQQELKAKEEQLDGKCWSHSLHIHSAGLLSPVLVQSFIMTFLAEWGDRSQIATIILGAREDPLGVTLGGILGHSICTFIAVMGGRFMAQRISVRKVTIAGGVVFLIFALSGLFFEDPSSEGMDAAVAEIELNN